jgi:beta-glucanase (GH16 family)
MTLPNAHILMIASMFAVGAAQAQDYLGWDLVWSDEFDGETLNADNWTPMIGNGQAYGIPGWGNNELQYYTGFADNIQVSDGTLKLIARRQSLGGFDYTSARIRTLNKAEFKYGRIEARIKLPSTPGIWPAFWMLPTDSPYGGWAASGEIDVMESVNYADRIYGTLHHGANWPQNAQVGPRFEDGTDYSQDFHVFSVDWDPDSITWAIDGVPYGTVTSNQWYSTAAPSNPLAPFDHQFHMLLNVAVGGNFPGNPNGASVFPQTMEVDYVRVYERVQEPFNGEPHTIPGVIEAEDFDAGTQGMSYNDCDASNNGGAYRETGVDIEVSTESGYNIGWICEGEWLEYTVDVQHAGEYRLDARVASQTTGGAFRIEQDGEALTDTVFFFETGGWQSWETVSTTLELEAGVQVLRVASMVTVQEFNLNSMTFTYIGDPGCNAADLAEPYNTLNFFDVSAFLNAFTGTEPSADFDGNGSFDFFDVSAFLAQYAQGCP